MNVYKQLVEYRLKVNIEVLGENLVPVTIFFSTNSSWRGVGLNPDPQIKLIIFPFF